jgi:6-bladed beta-propeller
VETKTLRPYRKLMLTSLLFALTLTTWTALAGDTGPASTGVQTLTFNEQWRAGQEDDDIFFGLISQVLIGPDANIYLLDSQLNEIAVFSPDGEFLRTISRQGEGPGEIQRAGTMMFMADKTLGVVQRFPGKIVKITPDGLPAGSIVPGDPTSGGREFLGDGKVSGEDLILFGSRNTRVDQSRLRHNYLARFDAEGRLVHEYVSRDDQFDFSSRSFNEIDEYFVGTGRWDVGPDGTVYAAVQRDTYRIDVYPADDGPARAITRDRKLWQRPAAMMDKLERQWKSTRRYQRFQTEQVFSPTEPAISRVIVRNDELWVLPADGQHDQPAGILQTWDVYGLDGRFDRRVGIACPGDGFRDMLFFTGANTAVIVAGFQDAMDALRGVGSDEDIEEEDAAPVQVIAYTIVQE